MDLNLELFDVEISLGVASNSPDRVLLRFRRSPDSDVAADILGLESKYGWAVTQLSRDNMPGYQIAGDFQVRCVGAKSDAVGMEIGSVLAAEHGLRVSYAQFVHLGPGRSRWTQLLNKLDLAAVLSEEA
jgi:hypothetical protein